MISCCGKPVEELVANTTDVAVEKHVLVYEKVGDKIIVKVGKVEYPMEEKHYMFIVINMDYGKQKLNKT